jgi:hypothetical protein
MLVYDAINLLGETWTLRNAKLAKSVELSQKASSTGVTARFIQRLAGRGAARQGGAIHRRPSGRLGGQRRRRDRGFTPGASPADRRTH